MIQTGVRQAGSRHTGALARAWTLFSLTFAVGCEEGSLCPYPNASPVEIVPAAPCLTANVETCIDPTMVVTNRCNSALYLPTEYARFGPDGAIGADIEILPGQTARYVLRPDKSTSQTSAKKTWVIPARVGVDKIELRFATFAD